MSIEVIFVGLIFLVLACLACTTSGKITSWTNSLGGSWEEPTNWDNGVPVNNDTVRLAMTTTGKVLCNNAISLAELQVNGTNVVFYGTTTFTKGKDSVSLAFLKN